MTAQTLKKFGVNLLLSMGAVLITLAFLEVGTRLISPFPTFSRYSAETGWRGKANDLQILDTDGYEHEFKLNSRGMHDTEQPFDKTPNTRRILMLGDSFVEARQVHETETAHQVLEDLLNQEGDSQSYSVISAGVPAWGTGQQLRYYQSEGRRYQPDLVVLMVYLGNDLTDNLPVHSVTVNTVTYYAPYFPQCDGRLDLEVWLYAPGVRPGWDDCSSLQKTLGHWLDRLYWHSRVYALLGPIFNRFQDDFFEKGLSFLHVYAPESHPVLEEEFSRETDAFDYGWQVMFGLIKALNQEVRQDGARLAVVLIDPADVINFAALSPEEKQARIATMPLLAYARLDGPERRFQQALAGEEIDLLNLQPYLVAETRQRNEALYFPDDKHWNVAGNRLVAETLAGWLP